RRYLPNPPSLRQHRDRPANPDQPRRRPNAKPNHGELATSQRHNDVLLPLRRRHHRGPYAPGQSRRHHHHQPNQPPDLDRARPRTPRVPHDGRPSPRQPLHRRLHDLVLHQHALPRTQHPPPSAIRTKSSKPASRPTPPRSNTNSPSPPT